MKDVALLLTFVGMILWMIVAYSYKAELENLKSEAVKAGYMSDGHGCKESTDER